jgi:hypothetical protein
MDGTNLAAMGVPLWCSALALYDSKTQTVLGSVVGLPSGRICVSRAYSETAWIAENATDGVVPDGNVPLHGAAPLSDLFDARIAFYGQKPASFLTMATNEKFVDFLNQAEVRSAKKKEEIRIRVYNFAGNPLLVKLVDRKRGPASRVAEGVDFVVELRGQFPHDFVPGAFIALQRGAYMCAPDGSPITVDDLGTFLTKPDKRQSYVIGASKRITEALLSYL